MKILAIETATEACSAALYVDETITERYAMQAQRHGQLILPMMDELLAEGGITVRQLDAVAFGRGPGSFTGLRIASGVTQGVAFAADLPVVPVSTLAALAQGVVEIRNVRRVLSALDARMGEVYWGAFEAVDGIVRLVGEEMVCPPDQAPMPMGGVWYGVGTGWSAYGEALSLRLSQQLAEAPQASLPRARYVVRLAVERYRNGELVSAEEALPVYLRNQVVQVPGRRSS